MELRLYYSDLNNESKSLNDNEIDYYSFNDDSQKMIRLFGKGRYYGMGFVNEIICPKELIKKENKEKFIIKDFINCEKNDRFHNIHLVETSCKRYKGTYQVLDIKTITERSFFSLKQEIIRIFFRFEFDNENNKNDFWNEFRLTIKNL